MEDNERRQRVLLVEDNPVDRETYRRFLTKDCPEHYELVFAETGEEALEACQAEKPDIVIVDYQLPDMDGIEVLANLTATGKRGPEVIFLTGQGDERVAVNAMKNGAADYLIKADVTANTLRQVMRRAAENAALRTALSRSQENFRSLVENSPDAILVHRNEAVIYANPALVAWLGHENGADLVGQPVVGKIVHPDDREQVPDRIADDNGGHPSATEIRCVHADGEIVIGEATAVRLLFDGVSANVIIFRDMTARRRMERLLIQSERLASLGTLAGGVSHEINNPLACLMANLEFLAEEVRALTKQAPSDQLREMDELIFEARKSAERIRQIVRGLRLFWRADADRPAVLDVHQVLDLSLNLTTNEVSHRARLVMDYGDVPSVMAAESHLAQVFINLLINAAQCFPEESPEHNEIRLVTRTGHNGSAVVEIRDTGPGIPPTIQRRIFDPFFTTKAVGDGSGLGLSIAHGLVSGMKGELECESVLGAGSTFRVMLPPIREDEIPIPEAHSDGRASGQRGTVLIVDQNPGVGASLRRILRDEHDVTVLTGARDALGQLITGAQFDVILCDVMMPGMSGIDLYEAMKTVAPKLAPRMVFMTGGAFTPAVRLFLDQVPNQRVEKPFDAQHIRALVRGVLRCERPETRDPAGPNAADT